MYDLGQFLMGMRGGQSQPPPQQPMGGGLFGGMFNPQRMMGGARGALQGGDIGGLFGMFGVGGMKSGKPGKPTFAGTANPRSGFETQVFKRG